MSRLQILVADDDVFLTELLRHKLQAAGHAVEVAADGHCALQRAQTGLFDVVILDGLMPKLDGFLLRRLNAEPPDPMRGRNRGGLRFPPPCAPMP